jgi:hypothetical protein
LEFGILQHVLCEIIVCFWVDKVDFSVSVDEADCWAWRAHADADLGANPD